MSEGKNRDLQAELEKALQEIVELRKAISNIEVAELSQTRLAAIVESSDDAIIGKDLNGIIQNWNKGAKKIFGYTAEEVIGKSIMILVPPDRVEEERGILSKLKRGERIDHFETVRVRKDGKQIDVSLSSSPIKDSKNRVVGASKIARDITERKQLERERLVLLEREKEARARAEEANRMKDEFMATISHELRTPLTSMLGWTRLLLAGNLDEIASLKALETIERNVKSQAQLVEDLLDISRITTGKLRLDLEPVNLSEVVSRAVEAISPAAEAKKIRLQTILDSRSSWVKGDFERLQQILWNLLSNAIKFTPANGRVQIQLEPRNSQHEIVITDTGIGVEPEFLPHVFEQFRQADSSITRKYGGLGMGLSIVKRLTEMHGGTVTVSSKGEGQGATFTLRFPALAVRKKIEASAHLHPKTSSKPKFEYSTKLSGLHILIVDDEPDTCAVLKTIFEQCGAEVRTSLSVEEALHTIDEWKPEVLVSDIGMPGQDGYDLIRKLRARKAEEGGKIPAIALTAFARIEDRVKALSEGYQMHVPKPVEPSELLTIVESLKGVIGQG